ncbi:MAG: ABC transporter permease [Lachnospiraceae bacterium]|nr:ABC transporter permease [Lachnospiraceae bacterium]
MFRHNLAYELKEVLRVKEFILWLMLFPIILGTLFKVAFGSIYSKEVFDTIPVAVVRTSDNQVAEEFLKGLSEEEKPMLATTYTDAENAKQLLLDGDVEGILTIGESIELTVSRTGILPTMLQELVSRYKLYETVIRDTIATDPGSLQTVLAKLSAEVNACRDASPKADNPDVYVQYFYNLIAMVAICGNMTGLHVSTNNQANQSILGARKNCSATPKGIYLTAGLLGSCIAQSVSMVLCVTFLRFVLRVNFGGSLLLLYLAAILSGCLGVAFGFFIGSIGKMKHEGKSAIAITVSMALCFLSGLMMGNIKGILAVKAPWVNRFNPVAIISDSFYCLNMYSDYRRFISKVIAMLIYTAVFTVLGVLFTRRKKYASI